MCCEIYLILLSVYLKFELWVKFMLPVNFCDGHFDLWVYSITHRMSSHITLCDNLDALDFFHIQCQSFWAPKKFDGLLNTHIFHQIW